MPNPKRRYENDAILSLERKIILSILKEIEPSGVFKFNFFVVINRETLAPSLIYDFLTGRWEDKVTGKSGTSAVALYIFKRGISQAAVNECFARLLVTHSDSTTDIM